MVQQGHIFRRALVPTWNRIGAHMEPIDTMIGDKTTSTFEGRIVEQFEDH